MELLHLLKSNISGFISLPSEGMARDLVAQVSKCAPDFDMAAKKNPGEKIAVFQTKIDSDNEGYVAVGYAQVGWPERAVLHEHIALLKVADYASNGIIPQILWDRYFIDYETFQKKKLSDITQLPLEPLPGSKTAPFDYRPFKDKRLSELPQLPRMRVETLPGSKPDLNGLKAFFGESKDALASMLHKMCLLAIPEPQTKKFDLAVRSMDEALQFLSLMLYLMPPELRPYISFLAGEPPISGTELFNLRVRIGRDERLLQVDIVTPRYRIAAELATAALAGKHEDIEKTHKSFQDIWRKGLKVQDDPDALKLNNEALNVWPDIQKLYDTCLKRAKSLYEERDLSKAQTLVQKMHKVWSEKDELETLERDINFLLYVGNKDSVERALALFTTLEEALNHIESLLRADRIDYAEVGPFFDAREKELDNILNHSLHQKTLMALERYRWCKSLAEHLTKESLKQKHDLVTELIEKATQLTEGYQQQAKASAGMAYHNATGSLAQSGAIGDGKATVKKSQRLIFIEDILDRLRELMQFDTPKEMGLLLDWRTEDESLYYILPRAIIGFAAVVDNDKFRALVTKYLKRVNDEMDRKTSEDTAMATSSGFPFAPTDLHRVYSNVLKPRIQEMQKAVTTRDEDYERAARRLNEIVTRLSDITIGVTRPISRPEKRAVEQRHDVSSTQYRVLDGVFKDDKLFLKELKDNPDSIRQKISEITSDEQAKRVLTVIKEMTFDPRREMENLIEKGDKSKSLFFTLPDVILELRPKIRPWEFEELITVYINKFLKGVVKEPSKGKLPLVKQKTEFAFSAIKLYTSYSKELQSKIDTMIKLKKQSMSEGSSFSKAIQDLEATILELQKYQ